jgi:hypothetical protein
MKQVFLGLTFVGFVLSLALHERIPFDLCIFPVAMGCNCAHVLTRGQILYTGDSTGTIRQSTLGDGVGGGGAGTRVLCRRTNADEANKNEEIANSGPSPWFAEITALVGTDCAMGSW